MAITKEQKEVQVKDFEDRLGRAKGVYFAANLGTDVKSFQDLRGKMRESDVEYRIIKKTLMKLALKNKGHEEVPAEVMEGPVGAAFGYEDVIAPAKLLHTFAKEHETIQILGGLVDGKFITKAEAIELAKLPSKEELLAKLVGSMKAPVSGFHGILAGLLRNFVYTLKQIEEQKAKDEPKVEEKKEEAKDEPQGETSSNAEAPAEAKSEESAEKKEEVKAEEKPAEAKEEAKAEEAKADDKAADAEPEKKEEEAKAEEKPDDDATKEDEKS